MGHTSERVFFRISLCIYMLSICNFVLGQNLNKDSIVPKHIRSKHNTLFSNDTLVINHLTDNLSYEICIVRKKHDKLLRLNSYEEARNAFMSSFAISLSDFSRDLQCYQNILVEQNDDESVKVGVRCFTDPHWVLVNVNELETSSGRCFSVTKGTPVNADTILIEEFVVPEGVVVSNVERVRNRYVFAPLSYGIDECGIIILTIPNDKESIFAFYDSSKYIQLLRFVPKE